MSRRSHKSGIILIIIMNIFNIDTIDIIKNININDIMANNIKGLLRGDFL